jgi:hypothetical protein
MGARVIQFGAVPVGILAALTGNGYELDTCGTSIPKLKQALQRRDDLDAITVAQTDASSVAGIVTTVRSDCKVPLILIQDAGRACDASQFDLVISEHAPVSDLMEQVSG